MYIYIGTPVFRSCNSSTCIKTACVPTPGTQVQLDLELVFINSISMIERPSPSVWRIENGQSSCTATSRNQSDCILGSDGDYSYSSTFPGDLTIAINVEQSEIYIATATIIEPSGLGSILNKTLVSKYDFSLVIIVFVWSDCTIIFTFRVMDLGPEKIYNN